jgi:hypothetical protein
MFDFNPAALVLGASLLAGYVAFLYLRHTKFALHLTVDVHDSYTEVLDAHGCSLVKLPNKMIYSFRSGKPHLLAIGQSLMELEATRQQEETNIQELDLVLNPEILTTPFRGSWASFILFCCGRARQQLDRRRSYLNVRVIARTSSVLANQKLQEEIEDKTYQSDGTFRVVGWAER